MGRGTIGKSKRGGPEYSELQALKFDNKKLRAENRRLEQRYSSLRKQLSKLDPSKFEAAQAYFDQRKKDAETEEVSEQTEQAKAEALAITWQCKKCEVGVLRITTFDHPHRGTIYRRRCSECTHATRWQLYDDKVRGIYEPIDQKEKKK